MFKSLPIKAGNIKLPLASSLHHVLLSVSFSEHDLPPSLDTLTSPFTPNHCSLAFPAVTPLKIENPYALLHSLSYLTSLAFSSKHSLLQAPLNPLLASGILLGLLQGLLFSYF